MIVKFRTRGGEKYWLNSDDKDFDRVINRILGQTGGWVILNVEVAYDIEKTEKHLVPCTLIADIGPYFTADTNEFETMMRSKIWY